MDLNCTTPTELNVVRYIREQLWRRKGDHSAQYISPLLLSNIRGMSSSQIYVEIERARLTKTLASIKEQSGEVKEAASILQELQVRDSFLR